MTTTKTYHIDWVAKFLHGFPHIDFNFEETNSSFNPQSTDYREVSNLAYEKFDL